MLQYPERGARARPGALVSLLLACQAQTPLPVRLSPQLSVQALPLTSCVTLAKTFPYFGISFLLWKEKMLHFNEFKVTSVPIAL